MYLVNLGALSTVAAFFCPGTLYLARKSFLHASQYFFSFLGGVPADTAYGSIFLSRCAERHETPPTPVFFAKLFGQDIFLPDFFSGGGGSWNVVRDVN